MIEKELLSIVFGATHFHQYVYGRHINVLSDHKPLETIFRKNLFAIPKRLQRMMLQLQSYNLTVNYKHGKEMFLADASSRNYINTNTG